MLDLTGEEQLAVACARTQSPGHEEVAAVELDTGVARVNKAGVDILDTTAGHSAVRVGGESVVEEGKPHRRVAEEGMDRRIHAVSCRLSRWASLVGCCADRASCCRHSKSAGKAVQRSACEATKGDGDGLSQSCSLGRCHGPLVVVGASALILVR